MKIIDIISEDGKSKLGKWVAGKLKWPTGKPPEGLSGDDLKAWKKDRNIAKYRSISYTMPNLVYAGIQIYELYRPIKDYNDAVAQYLAEYEQDKDLKKFQGNRLNAFWTLEKRLAALLAAGSIRIPMKWAAAAMAASNNRFGYTVGAALNLFGMTYTTMFYEWINSPASAKWLADLATAGPNNPFGTTLANVFAGFPISWMDEVKEWAAKVGLKLDITGSYVDPKKFNPKIDPNDPQQGTAGADKEIGAMSGSGTQPTGPEKEHGSVIMSPTDKNPFAMRVNMNKE